MHSCDLPDPQEHIRVFPSHYEQLLFLSFLLSFGPLYYYSHCYLRPQTAMKLEHMPMIDFNKWFHWRAFHSEQVSYQVKHRYPWRSAFREQTNQILSFGYCRWDFQSPSFILIGHSPSKLVMLHQETGILFFKVAGKLKNGKCGQGKIKCMLFPLVIH